MLKTREVFEERSEEIALYFNFIYEVIDRRAMLSLTPTFSASDQEIRELKHIPSDVIDTLKANGFLLLYNIVEATITRAVQAIYLDIEKHDHRFDELHPLLRKHITATFRKDDDSYKRILESTHPISKSIIRAGFEASRLFSGNIHHKTLKEFADKLGFSVDTDGEKTRGGQRLTDVKNRRNELAHGNMSFLACGKVTSIEQILEIRNEVICYLEGILDNIEEYLKSKKYLEINA